MSHASEYFRKGLAPSPPPLINLDGESWKGPDVKRLTGTTELHGIRKGYDVSIAKSCRKPQPAGRFGPHVPSVIFSPKNETLVEHVVQKPFGWNDKFFSTRRRTSLPNRLAITIGIKVPTSVGNKWNLYLDELSRYVYIYTMCYLRKIITKKSR